MEPIDSAGATSYRRSPTNQGGGVRKAARTGGTHLRVAGLTYLAILINCSLLGIRMYVTMKMIGF